MYEQHFGLKKRPFCASATGTEVFVGPQAAKMMAGLTKALSTRDAIVTVSGPVGAGKSTLAAKTMEGIGSNRKIIHVGRIQLNSQDVLELLLSELGLDKLPNGTIQKFAAFRRRLKELEEAKTRVLIAVEDGMRIGADSLGELEALTAADAGDSEGASIVVMGDERLDKFLQDPQLARLRQRVRQHHSVEPLSAAELRGYLMHCFRMAGGNFESLFEADAADLIHQLSDGIPRVVNNLIESTLTAAAEAGTKTVSSEMLLQVARDEYGLSADRVTTVSPATSQPVAQPEAVAVPMSAPAANEPLPQADEIEIPELIQDTQRELPVLPAKMAEAAKQAEVAPDPKPVPKPEPVAAEAPEQVPDWDRDPTFAELKPDLAALEQAMALAQGGDPDSAKSQKDGDAPAKEEAVVEKVPEITLDHAISQKIADNLIDEPGEVSPPDSVNADPELARVATELAKAKTIDDVDDKMAETLFGEELNMAAAEVRATMQLAESAKNDDDVPSIELQVTAEDSTVAPAEVNVAATSSAGPSGLDPSASERLKTVRALNSDTHPSMRDSNKQPAANPAPVQPAPPEIPKSIEDQINTSLTQTLKTLDIVPPVTGGVSDDDDEEEENKGGFLSRFKRS